MSTFYNIDNWKTTPDLDKAADYADHMLEDVPDDEIVEQARLVGLLSDTKLFESIKEALWSHFYDQFNEKE